MGIGFMGRGCSSSPYAVIDSNPKPDNFKILNEQYLNGYLILIVEYPDCKNYEGKKLLVYKGFTTGIELLKHNDGKLDPHFSKDKGSPIARFKPTIESMELVSRMIGV
jgi:hypothetical protein